MSTCSSFEHERQALTCPQRLPDLTAHGVAMLRRMREHPAAPIFRNYSGHRMTRIMRIKARVQHQMLQHAPVPGRHPPAWLWPWLLRWAGDVPDWPHPLTLHHGWSAIRTCERSDFAWQLTRHVPRSHQTDRLLCFSTSGTTGHPLRVPTLPLVASAYQALHHRALHMLNVQPRAGRGDVGVVLAGYQQRCFTYVSVNPLRGECGLAKINLHPSEWRHPDDRGAYLDAMRPELISGDPISLCALAELPMRHRPRALLSTSMALSTGLREQLERHFCAPVLDVYSMNEAGPIAAYVPRVDAFVLLQPGLYVELLDDNGQAVPPGTRGEITLTGGINPCLPLLRYRTGDHARWINTPLGPALADLQGRPPVRFRHECGQWVNNVELSQALRHLPLRRFALHQQADGSLNLRIDTSFNMHQNEITRIESRLRESLAACLGSLPLSIMPLQEQDKVRQYTSDLPGATCAHALRS
ncbi:MAG: hypothetical protein QG554_1982 [Pseudomonadota bacterium]|jgi:phenylacetate-CoA ligase|nr:hypothetical protein [Pseudomonadota bacterium]